MKDYEYKYLKERLKRAKLERKLKRIIDIIDDKDPDTPNEQILTIRMMLLPK